jgi:hypothetical protein
MADSVLGRLKVIIGADVSQLQDGMRRAESAVKGSALILARTFGAALGGLTFAALSQSTLAYADSLTESADTIGIAVVRFRELQFAAQQSGISAESFRTSLQFLADEAGRAGITTQRAFELATIAIQQAKDQAEAVAIARDKFGRGGAAFALLLRDGEEGLRNLTYGLKGFGAELDEGAIRRVAEVNDKLDAFVSILKDKLVLALDAVLPFLRELGSALKTASDSIPIIKAQALLRIDEKRLQVLKEQLGYFEKTGKLQGQFFDRSPAEGEIARMKAEADRLEAALEIMRDMNTGPTSQPGPLNPPIAPGPRTQDERAFFEGLNRRTEATRKQSSADREAATAAKQLADEVEGLYASTRTPLEQLNQEWTRLDELLSRGAIDWDTYARAVLDASAAHTEIARTTKQASDLGADLGLTFSSAFEDAIAGGRELGEVLRGLAADLLRLTTRTLITEPLAEAFAGFDIVGLLSGLLPGRASGGPVYPGQAYVVGERGPELLVPGSAGRVLPGGAGGVTVNIVEAPGSGGQVQRSTRGGQTVVDVMVERVRGAIAGDIMRGSGPVAAAIERTYGAARAAGAF